jgi:16S rRNA (cytosine1402-N4)-methyltransferase
VETTLPPETAPHVPVMLDRVVELLATAPPGVVVDATVGSGGHAAAVQTVRARRHATATLVGIDRDPDALALAERRLRDAPGDVHLVHARFDRLDAVLDDLGVDAIAGALLDLGVSSLHLDRPERGFSYRHEGPLDMRMDPTAGPTAADLVNRADRDELARIIGRYGEERFAGRIAAAVVRARPVTTTRQLAEVVRDAIPAATRRTGGHPATRTFQALRVAVNHELEALEAVLPRALARLASGGVCVAIAYHSLEDRLVKQAFAAAATGCVCPPDLPVCACGNTPDVDLVTRRPERPSPEEVAANPRARSARLRAVRKRPTEAAA